MGDAHIHPDADVLTIGCPACIERRRIDQENTRWFVAPLRRCTFTLPWSGVASFSADLRVPAGCGAIDVLNRYEHMLAMKVHELLEATNPANGGVFDQALKYLSCAVGPTVEDVQAEPPIDVIAAICRAIDNFVGEGHPEYYRMHAKRILDARIPIGNGKEEVPLVQALAIGVVMLQADGDLSRFVDEEYMDITPSALLKYILCVVPEYLFDLEDRNMKLPETIEYWANMQDPDSPAEQSAVALAREVRRLQREVVHHSDCAVHANENAEQKPCSCGVQP